MPRVQSSIAAERSRWLVGLAVGERLLVIVGLACVSAWAVACTHGSWFQWQEDQAFDQQLRERIQAEQHDTSEWSRQRIKHYEAASAGTVTALARLEIPAADLSVMVLDGTDELTLNRAVGRIEGTAHFGESGNVGIAGHRDGFFRGLQHLEVGDTLTLTTLDGVAHYEVAALEVVEPTEVEVLAPTEHDALTLVTCFPFYFVGDAPQRYIVHARKLRFQSFEAAQREGLSSRRDTWDSSPGT